VALCPWGHNASFILQGAQFCFLASLFFKKASGFGQSPKERHFFFAKLFSLCLRLQRKKRQTNSTNATATAKRTVEDAGPYRFVPCATSSANATFAVILSGREAPAGNLRRLFRRNRT